MFDDDCLTTKKSALFMLKPSGERTTKIEQRYEQHKRYTSNELPLDLVVIGVWYRIALLNHCTLAIACRRLRRCRHKLCGLSVYAFRFAYVYVLANVWINIIRCLF